MTCAFAVRGALKKFQGVESVDVSLNKGLATVKLKPGNAITAEQFWEVVKKNGYTPKETRVVVRGEVLMAAGKTQLNVTGTDRTYELASHTSAPKALDEIKRLAAKTVTVEGTFTPGKDVKIAPPLQVQAVRP
jgi:copper chaperone CopZ